MIILTPDLHERKYQKQIKIKLETALEEMGLRDYWIKWDPYENRGDLFVMNNAGREILVIEVKKTKQDVTSPRFWDQARRYVLNSRNWQPDAPKIFCITNAELIYTFCLRPDFTHIKYCLLENGRVDNGQFGPNGEADEVLNQFKESIKKVLEISLLRVPISYDQNWYPVLEKFRVELNSLTRDLKNSLSQLFTDNDFRRRFEEWAQLLYPYYSQSERKNAISEQISASMLFKALCYEIIRYLIIDIPLDRLRNIRLNPITDIDNAQLAEALAELYTDIIRIDYHKIFESDDLSDTITLSQAGVASLSSFIMSLNLVGEARQEISDPDFLIASLVDTLILPHERHETGLTIEHRRMVELLTHICIRNPDDRVIDIAAGTCAILVGVYDRLKELKMITNTPYDHQVLLGQLTAIESNQFIAKVAALRFALKNLLGDTAFDVKIMDAFSFRPDADYDVIICNPPYLRQADIPSSYKTYMRNCICEGYRTQGIDGSFPYSRGQADKYFYFFEWGMLFLKPGGIAGFILSDKFLNSTNGSLLKKFMLEQTNLKAIIKYPGRYFEEFKITTCFVIAQKKNPAGGNENKVRFIRLFKDITPERLYQFLESPQSSNTAEARVVVEDQSALNHRHKWGKKLLNLPPSYDHCLEPDFMQNLKNIFNNRAKRGKDNGCNAFFFPTSTGFIQGSKEPINDFEQRRRDYKDHIERLVENIEPHFLKSALNSADLPSNYFLEVEDINKEQLLVVPTNVDLDQNEGLRLFINFAEQTYTDREGNVRAILDGKTKKINERPTIYRRQTWYCLYKSNEIENDYALIIPRMHRAIFKILIPQSTVYFSTNFVGFGSTSVVNPEDIKFIVGFLMSSLGQLQFEAEGDWREGLLKIEARQMYKIRAPNPQQINANKKNAVINAFEGLRYGLNGLEKPGTDNSRFGLDKTIMCLFYPETESENKVLEIEEALYQTVNERDPRNRNR
jgi:hypothetical protein